MKGIILYITIVGLLICSGCSKIEIYESSNSPFFVENSFEADDISDTVSVVSFNIEKAEKIDLALSELQDDNRFRDPTILLLQEMDKKGVETISEALRLNYIYYPISKNKEGNDFGNAIMTKAKILEHEKLILPHSKFNGRIRNAPNCTIEINGKSILLYSIHAETVAMNNRKRGAQMKYIIDDIQSKSDSVDIIIAGGDFNTLYTNELRRVRDLFKTVDMDMNTSEIGATSSYLLGALQPRLDHIFSKGMTQIENGKLKSSKSSDHLPIYVTYDID